jgi:hypothetical protein
MTNDCTSNAGSLILIGSFVPPPGISALVGAESIISVTFVAPTVPAWWQIQQSGGCRTGSMSASFKFPGLTSCVNPWSSNVLGGSDLELNPPCCPSANFARIHAVCVVPEADSVATAEGIEYYAFEILINRKKSIGTGSCDGCATAACLELRFLHLYQARRPDPFGLSDVDQNRRVTYNNSSVNDCLYVPVRNRSWGAVKAMYR